MRKTLTLFIALASLMSLSTLASAAPGMPMLGGDFDVDPIEQEAMDFSLDDGLGYDDGDSQDLTYIDLGGGGWRIDLGSVTVVFNPYNEITGGATLSVGNDDTTATVSTDDEGNVTNVSID